MDLNPNCLKTLMCGRNGLASLRLVDLNIEPYYNSGATSGLASLRLVDLNMSSVESISLIVASLASLRLVDLNGLYISILYPLTMV